MSKTLAMLKSSQSVEWYTPPEHTVLVRRVLGYIDLDPASTMAANRFILAHTIYTKNDGDNTWKLVGGFPWFGNVYCNPPYGRLAGKFVEKLLQEFKAGRVKAGIMCLSGYAFETKWFRPILSNLQIPICWVHGRVRFVKPDGTVRPSTVGTVYAHLGENRSLFVEVFSEIGTIR